MQRSDLDGPGYAPNLPSQAPGPPSRGLRAERGRAWTTTTGAARTDPTASPAASATAPDQMPRLPEPGSLRPWAGPAVTLARSIVAAATNWPTPCARCRQPVWPHAWHLGHRHDRQAHPELTWVP